jgi:hypothetical protein
MSGSDLSHECAVAVNRTEMSSTIIGVLIFPAIFPLLVVLTNPQFYNVFQLIARNYPHRRIATKKLPPPNIAITVYTIIIYMNQK